MQFFARVIVEQHDGHWSAWFTRVVSSPVW